MISDTISGEFVFSIPIPLDFSCRNLIFFAERLFSGKDAAEEEESNDREIFR